MYRCNVTNCQSEVGTQSSRDFSLSDSCTHKSCTFLSHPGAHPTTETYTTLHSGCIPPIMDIFWHSWKSSNHKTSNYHKCNTVGCESTKFASVEHTPAPSEFTQFTCRGSNSHAHKQRSWQHHPKNGPMELWHIPHLYPRSTVPIFEQHNITNEHRVWNVYG